MGAACGNDAVGAVYRREGQYCDKGFICKISRYAGFCKADLKELEQDIKPTGFYHNKAKNVIGCAQRICQVYGGEVPRSLEDLVSLPGVGRKTANVIRGNIFHEPV